MPGHSNKTNKKGQITMEQEGEDVSRLQKLTKFQRRLNAVNIQFSLPRVGNSSFTYLWTYAKSSIYYVDLYSK